MRIRTRNKESKFSHLFVSQSTSSSRRIIYPTPSQCSLTTTIEESIDDAWCEAERDKVEEKAKQLLNDISIQKHHMMQASHALNTCASTFEFSGSTESVVAEWKLLVTSEFNSNSILFFFLCLLVRLKPRHYSFIICW